MLKITPQQKSQVKIIGNGHKLDFIILHGSQATGKIVSPEPDIDLAVYRRGGIDFKELISLTCEFMGVFGNDVDVKTLHKKDPLFRFEVMRDGILLYGDAQKFNEFFIYTYKDYQESKPLYNALIEIQRKRQSLFNQLYAKNYFYSQEN